MHIQQINTSAVLRQFATLFGNDLVEVKTKLGPMTVVSASFNLNDFPDDEEIQIEFLKSLSQKQTLRPLPFSGPLQTSASRTKQLLFGTF